MDAKVILLSFLMVDMLVAVTSASTSTSTSSQTTKPNPIKTLYETELKEVRDVIDVINKEKTRLQVQLQMLQEQMVDLQRQVDDAKKWRAQDQLTMNKLNQQVSDLEAEIRMLRRTNDSLDRERLRDKLIITRLNGELEKLRMDFRNEIIQRRDAENRAQTLREEIEFLKQVHEQELKTTS